MILSLTNGCLKSGVRAPSNSLNSLKNLHSYIFIIKISLSFGL